MKNNIGLFRKKNGLSMQELAELAGTSQQQIDRLEKGQRRLTADWMEKLSKPLKCKPAELMSFEADTTRQSKVEVANAKVLGAIETHFSNSVREFADDEQYEISFKPTKKDFGKKFFALTVEGGSYKGFPENSELIFSMNKSSKTSPSLQEKPNNFAANTVKTNNYKFEIGDKLIEGHLVKSIRNE